MSDFPERLTGSFPLPEQLQLSAVKLAELHSDLKIQEKDELRWKKLKAEGLDEDGEKEAQLRRNLHGKIQAGSWVSL